MEIIEEPSKTIQSIIRHELSRESKVLRCIDKNKNSNLDELLPLVYDDIGNAPSYCKNESFGSFNKTSR